MVSKIYSLEQIPRNLIQELHEQQKTGDLCDYELKTQEGVNFKVHKWVLRAASSFFGILFNNNGFGENNSNFLQVPDVSGKVLDKVIEFMYTGVIEMTSDIAKEVMNVALFFNLNALIDYCNEILLEMLNEENCLDLLKFSETCVHYGKKLTEESLKLVCKKFNTFVELPDFYELSSITMKILMNQSRTTYTEDNLYLAVVNWIGFDSENRKNFIDELIDKINFKDLSNNFSKSFLKSLSHKDSFFKSLSNNKLTQRELKLDSESEQGNLYIFADNCLLSYNKSDNEFSKIITRMKDKLEYFECTTFGKDKVFICGGRKGADSVKSCKYFSMQDKCWTDLPSMKSPQLFPKLTTMDDQIYVCGIFTDVDELMITIELFDINTSMWSQKCTLKNYKLYNALFNRNYDVCHLNKCIYFIHPNRVQRLDPKLNQWEILSDRETNFEFQSVEAYDHFIYAFSQNSIRTFDIRTNKWMEHQVEYKKQYEIAPKTCVIGNQTYVLGRSEETDKNSPCLQSFLLSDLSFVDCQSCLSILYNEFSEINAFFSI